MNIARLDFSQWGFSGYEELNADLRKAQKPTGHCLTMMEDLPGPKMRIGKFESDPTDLKPVDRFPLRTDEIVGDAKRGFATFVPLPRMVKAEDRTEEFFLTIRDGIYLIRKRGTAA